MVDHSIDYKKEGMAFEMARRSIVEVVVVGVGDYSSVRTKTSMPPVRLGLL